MINGQGETLYYEGTVHDITAQRYAAAAQEQARDEALKAAEPEIARGATKGILHANTAARKVSRLTRRVNKLGAATA